MSKSRRTSLYGLIVSILTLPSVTSAADVPTSDLVKALQEGGHVLYIRHAQTESDYADQVTADPLNCATQRVLSRAGWSQAREIGDGVARLDIPVSEVLSSQYCRAWQTADLAFGRTIERAELNFEPAEDYSAAQIDAMRSRVLPLITAPITDGGNRIIVGHDDPFEAVTGIYPEPQGAAYVLKVEGDQVEILGMIAPEAWTGL